MLVLGFLAMGKQKGNVIRTRCLQGTGKEAYYHVDGARVEPYESMVRRMLLPLDDWVYGRNLSKASGAERVATTRPLDSIRFVPRPMDGDFGSGHVI